ncbi:MAG: hypothetical protein Q7W44_10580 [Coriobacteriia bacterium]|nr:hypothetical protein [Coriobacteriia bacterium]
MKHRYAYERELVADLVDELPATPVSNLPLAAAWGEVVFSTRVVDVVGLYASSQCSQVGEALAGFEDRDLLVLAAIIACGPISSERLTSTLGAGAERAVKQSVGRLMNNDLVSPGPRALRSSLGEVLKECEVAAIEAKLHKQKDVLRQAEDNLGLADFSYVALPVTVAFKEDFLTSARTCGLGVMSVDPTGLFVLVRAPRRRGARRGIVQTHFTLRLLQESAARTGRWISTGGTT